jgi:hypothetical protein
VDCVVRIRAVFNRENSAPFSPLQTLSNLRANATVKCDGAAFNSAHKPSQDQDKSDLRVQIHFVLRRHHIQSHMNNNQHDAMYIFSLLRYHTSTCFGRTSSPSSGGRMYKCGKWYLLYSALGKSLCTYKRCWK